MVRFSCATSAVIANSGAYQRLYDAGQARTARLLALRSTGFLREEGWRKPKRRITHLRKDVHYGQYLQVPRASATFLSGRAPVNAGSLIAPSLLFIIAAVLYFPLDLDVHQLGALRFAKQQAARFASGSRRIASRVCRLTRPPRCAP